MDLSSGPYLKDYNTCLSTFEWQVVGVFSMALYLIQTWNKVFLVLGL